MIEAEVWTPGKQVAGVCLGASSFCDLEIQMDLPHVHTLEGPLSVQPGDWIVKDIKGEFYPVKPDVFEATYELVGGEKEDRED